MIICFRCLRELRDTILAHKLLCNCFFFFVFSKVFNMTITKKTVISVLVSIMVLLTYPVNGERGAERGASSSTLVRGRSNRALKGGKGSLKASKIDSQAEFDAALDKLAEKCSKITDKIDDLTKSLELAEDKVTMLETDVESQAGDVAALNGAFPSQSSDPKILADVANKYLDECRLLEDEVNDYKKAVYDAAKIQAKLDSYDEELQNLVDDINDFIDDVEAETDFTGTLPEECEAP